MLVSNKELLLLLFATVERSKYMKNISPRKRLIADIYARLLTDIGVGDCAQVQVYRTLAWRGFVTS